MEMDIRRDKLTELCALIPFFTQSIGSGNTRRLPGRIVKFVPTQGFTRRPKPAITISTNLSITDSETWRHFRLPVQKPDHAMGRTLLIDNAFGHIHQPAALSINR